MAWLPLKRPDERAFGTNLSDFEMSFYRKPAPKRRDPNAAIQAKLAAFAREDAQKAARSRWLRRVTGGLLGGVILAALTVLFLDARAPRALPDGAGIVIFLALIALLGFGWTRLAESIDVEGGGRSRREPGGDGVFKGIDGFGS
ncbi:MAG: hypothetical protein AAGA56_05385 [Myxococcota bacterium]